MSCVCCCFKKLVWMLCSFSEVTSTVRQVILQNTMLSLSADIDQAS